VQQHKGWLKNWHIFVRFITSSNIDQFSNFFHCQSQEKICSNNITKDLTTHQMCRYLVKCQCRNATVENKFLLQHILRH